MHNSGGHVATVINIATVKYNNNECKVDKFHVHINLLIAYQRFKVFIYIAN